MENFFLNGWSALSVYGALAMFQRFINSTLPEFLNDFCWACIVDVIIYSDGDLEDYFNKVHKVINALKTTELCLDLDKGAFGVKKIKYLGFTIEAGADIKVDPEN